jgi:uncharacterized protein DUF3592
MMDWFLDVLVGYLVYLIRIVIRMIKARGGSTWPVVKAKVTGSTCDATYRGAIAEVTYTYPYQGGHFAGIHREPCVLRGSAEEYVARFPAGGDIIVRVKPETPEASIVCDRDQAIGLLLQK